METAWYQRTEKLLGTVKLEILKRVSVILFGVGGVGGFCAEALIRAGVGRLVIVDFDKIDVTNINRQIVALRSTVGKAKVDVMAQRAKDINPEIEITALERKLTKENIDEFYLSQFDYIIDAVDDVKAKLLLIQEAKHLGIPIISSMGTGNKKDPFQFKIEDITRTHTCPLAKVMRKELGKLGISEVKVLFSEEAPKCAQQGGHVASISYNPAVAGLMIASEVIRDLTET